MPLRAARGLRGSLALRPRLLRPSDNSSSVVSCQFFSYFFRPQVLLSIILFVLNISSSVLKIMVPLSFCSWWFTNPWTLSSGNTACAGVRWVAYFPFCRRERHKSSAAVVSCWILIRQRILSAASILFTYFIWFTKWTLWVKHFVVQ